MGLLTRDVGETVSITWQLELDATSTWCHLVDLDTWPAWIGSPIEGSLQPGVLLVVDHGDGYLCTSEVESVEVEHSLVMSWSFPDEHRTWLELTVSGPGEGESVVVLSHHELAALSVRTRSGGSSIPPTSKHPQWDRFPGFTKSTETGHEHSDVDAVIAMYPSGWFVRLFGVWSSPPTTANETRRTPWDS